MKLFPLATGLALGLILPLVVVAPAYFFGPLMAVLEGGRVYLLIPALALLLLPGIFLGEVATRYLPDRRSAWRLVTGLFLGASLGAAILLWFGSEDATFLRRFVIAAFGGPILAGVWMWLGAVLGLSFGYGRRERAEADLSQT